jgi:hypothetical protein
MNQKKIREFSFEHIAAQVASTSTSLCLPVIEQKALLRINTRLTGHTSLTGGYKISFNNVDQPFTIEVQDDGQVVDYRSVTISPGVDALQIVSDVVGTLSADSVFAEFIIECGDGHEYRIELSGDHPGPSDGFVVIVES